MNQLKYLLATLMTLAVMACQSASVRYDPYDKSLDAYLDGKQSDIAVILCHGRGKHATWLVVDPLRKAIHKKLGYHTLSLQMPTADVDWRDYEYFFPQAYKKIELAIRFLKEKKGVKAVYLMGHSMGSRMASSFLARHPDAGVSGFIGVGIRNGGDVPLDSNENLRNVKLPVIDLYGDGGNARDKYHAMKRSDMLSQRYQQVLIPGANHKFTEHEAEMINAVVSWLEKQKLTAL